MSASVKHIERIIRAALCAALASPAYAQEVARLAPVFQTPSAPVGAFALAAAPALPSVDAAAAVELAALPIAPPSLSAAAPAPAAPSPLTTEASAAARAPAAVHEGISGEGLRARWEGFWSGAAASAGLPAAVALSPARFLHALPLHAAHAAGAGGVLVGAYALDRGLRWGVARVAARRRLDPHRLAAARLIARAALWTGAALGALAVGGASQAVMTAAAGAGGAILTMGLKDTLGNWLQGVIFLVSRPFTVGDRVQINDQVGRVTGVDFSGLTLTRDDGALVKIRHTALAATPAIAFGPFREPGDVLVPVRPRLHGAASALLGGLGRGFWISAAALAALALAPALVSPAHAPWLAPAARWTAAAALLPAAHALSRGLSSAAENLARRNGWRPENLALVRLGARALAWTLGGGALLRVVGLSWSGLAASLGLTTIGLGLATNNVLGTALLGAEILFSRPFTVGDSVQLGSISGVVSDVTLSHVVVRVDADRRAFVPYAVIRDGLTVVNPGKSNP